MASSPTCGSLLAVVPLCRSRDQKIQPEDFDESPGRFGGGVVTIFDFVSGTALVDAGSGSVEVVVSVEPLILRRVEDVSGTAEEPHICSQDRFCDGLSSVWVAVDPSSGML